MTSSFNIKNSSEKGLIIIHEPECFEFYLQPNDEVTIAFNSSLDSVLLRHSIDDNKIVVSIIDDKSSYRVIHHGVDIFENIWTSRIG